LDAGVNNVKIVAVKKRQEQW